MIDQAIYTRAPKHRRPVDRWRRWWLFALLAAVMAAAGLASARKLRSVDVEPVAARPAATPAQTPSAQPAAPVLEATISPPPATEPASGPGPTQLQLPGKVPSHGDGTFTYTTRRGAVLGTNGPLRRFRVGVENGSDENVETFADQVEKTLGDPRSWTGGGTLRLQMVAAGDPYDFEVLLATRDTAGDLCLRGGTNIRIFGRPYTSCRTTGRAILNLDRWRLSAEPYLAAQVPLATYRQYVVNHEVGHELGHHHEGCPEANGPAPVMVQQTITLRGCVPYSWPRRGNRPLRGPPL
jgi:uncharacterized protein DUF3152